MFQGLVESLLRRMMGEYVEDLDKRALSVSVYSGEVDLHDLKLKKDIFDKFNVPVKLIFGRIKRLFLKVPWNALSSKPVQLEIEGVELVIEPLENQFWEELVERQNKIEVLQQQLLEFTIEKLKEMMAERAPKDGQAEAAAKQGFLVSLTSKVVDNLQVSIQNIHVRYEDTRFAKEPLSMGITLEQLAIQTTNESWENEFIDRTVAKNKDKPLRKLLDLRNIGFYCKPGDATVRMTSLIPSKLEQYATFGALFPPNTSISEVYKDCYILRPISILAKFKQLSTAKTSNALAAAREPIYQLSLDVGDFEFAFLKTQFEAVLKFFESVHEFQMFQDNFMNKKKSNLEQFERQPEIFLANKQIFLTCLDQLVTKEVKIMSYGSKKIPKDAVTKITNAAQLAKDNVEVYQNFIKYENGFVLRKWADKMVAENYAVYKGMIDEEEKIQEQQKQNKGGMVSYIGSWLGGAAKPQEAIRQNIPKNIQQNIQNNIIGQLTEQAQAEAEEDDFQDAVDHTVESADIEQMSAQIYQNFDEESSSLQQLIDAQREANESVPMFQAQFHLKKFKFSMVDDSADLVESESDLLNEYQSNEIFAFIQDVNVKYTHFDADNMNNINTGELRASIGDLGLTYHQKYKESQKIIMKEHKVLWKREPEGTDFIEVNLDIANAKLKQLSKQSEFVDQNLDVKMKGIFFEYRKEYIEFFITFFSSSEEFKDEMKLKALEEYERLRDAVSLASVLEAREKMETTFKVKVELQNSIAMFPIYRTIQEAEYDQPLNHLMDITNKSCWVVETGDVCFSKGDKNPRCPKGFAALSINVQPCLYFTEDLALWWNKDADTPKNTICVLEKFMLDLMIKIKESGEEEQPGPEGISDIDKQQKKDKSLSTAGVTYDISLSRGHIYVNPLIYNHLINVATIFKRPLASSGDALLLKQNERKHIFQKAAAIAVVRKKGNTISVWYEYVAVFSGSYIYFYPSDDLEVIIEIMEFYHGSAGSQIRSMVSHGDGSVSQLEQPFDTQRARSFSQRSAQGFAQKQKQFKDLDYEEWYLLKGCSGVRNYADYIGEVKHQSKHNQEARTGASQAAQHTTWMSNSSNLECILEYRSNEAYQLWSDLIVNKANDIDRFLKKDEFAFGNFGSISASKAHQKIQETILQEQLDQKNNFDHLVTDDPLQLLAAYEVSITKLTIVAEGLTQFKLKSKSVDPSHNDLIVLSSQVPEQLNKKSANSSSKRLDDQDKFQFFFEAEKLFFGFYHRELDNDMVVSLQSLRVIDRSANPTNKRDFDPASDELGRYQALLYSDASKGQQDMIKVVFKMQELKSPRYEDVEKDLDVQISTIHLNWSPIAYNRFIRLIRFIKYPFEVIEAEKRRIQQTLKARLQNLHREFDLRAGVADHDKVKQRLKTLDMIKQLTAAVEGAAGSEKEPNNPPEGYEHQLPARGRSKTFGAKSASESLNALTLLSLDKCSQRTTCQDDPTVLVAVRVTVEKIKLVCLHPQNDSYPIFTGKIDKLFFEYGMHQDHDVYKCQIGNFKILDNTGWPQTFDPKKTYGRDSKPHSQQILGLTEQNLKSSQEAKGQETEDEVVLSFEMTSFNFPEDCTCPLQNTDKNRQFGKLLKLNIKQIQIVYMQEQILRLSDYFLQQLLGSVSDTNPYEDVISKLEKEIDPFADTDELQVEETEQNSKLNRLAENMLNKKQNAKDGERPAEQQRCLDSIAQFYGGHGPADAAKDAIPNKEEPDGSQIDSGNSRARPQVAFLPNSDEIDLEQVPLATGLDIVIENPQIIIKDRPYLLGALELDLGFIKITNELEHVSGRWKEHPDKLVGVNTMYIDAKSIKIDHTRQLIDNVTPPFDLSISYQTLLPSSMLVDRKLLDFARQGPAASHGIDFNQFENQDRITITSSMNIEMNIKQNVYKYILRCLDLNINFCDGFEQCFQFRSWGDLNTMKSYAANQQVKEQFKDTSIKRREIKFQFPALSLKCRNHEDESLLSELVLRSLDIDIHQFLDSRNHVNMRSRSFYVLYKEKEEQMVSKRGSSAEVFTDIKRLILGPINSSSIIETSPSFYTQDRQEMGEQRPDQKQNRQEDDFSFTARLAPDGTKTMALSLQKLKLFLRMDQLLILKSFFMDGMPSYDKCHEKPAQFDPDQGNASKKAFSLRLKESLICFEQLTQQPSSMTDLLDIQQLFNAQAEQQRAPQGDYFTKTVAFRGEVQFTYVQEKPNQIKEHLIQKVRGPVREGSSFVSSASIMEKIEEQAGNSQHPLVKRLLEIVGLQPFFCDIKDLYEGGLSLTTLSKRQMIYPFNMKYESVDMIESQRKQMQEVMGAAGRGSVRARALQQKLMMDDYFKYFAKTKFTFDVTEIYVSFNDLIVVQGIITRLRQLDDELNHTKKKEAENKEGDRQASAHSSDQDAEEIYVRSYFDSDGGDPDLEEADGARLAPGQAIAEGSLQQESSLFGSSTSQGLSHAINEGREEVSITSSLFSSQQPQAAQHRETIMKYGNAEEDDDEKYDAMRHRSSRRQTVMLKQNMDSEQKEIQFKRLQTQHQIPQHELDFMSASSTNSKGMEQLDKQLMRRTAKGSSSILLGGAATPNPVQDSSQRQMKEQSTAFGSEQSRDRAWQSRSTKPPEDSRSYPTRPDSQRGVDELLLISNGLKLIVINDRDSNFLPIMSLNSSPCKITAYNTPQQSSIETVFKLSLNFFNVNIGMWEPFIEKFQFAITSTQDIIQKKLIMNMVFPEPVNMNFTEKLIENLNESQKSWKICQEEYKQFEQESQKNHTASLKQPMEDIEYDVGRFAQSIVEFEPYHAAPKLSVVDMKLRKTISRQRSLREDDLAQPRLKGRQSASAQNSNEDMISPYVIVNKTDLTMLIKRLFKREESERYQYSDFLNSMDKSQILEQQRKESQHATPAPGNADKVDEPELDLLQSQLQAAGQERREKEDLIDRQQRQVQQSRTNGLKNMYRLPQGQIVDYMVDYDTSKSHSEVELLLRGATSTPSGSGDPSDLSSQQRCEEQIHNDHIGEYKSEFTKIQFDKTTAEVSHNRHLFDENNEISKVDLNRLGYQTHVIRGGERPEKIFYGCKLIDCKKVFTVRSQFQIVNFTGFDYLIYFRYKNSCLIKHLESGDSLAVSQRYDDFKVQIKMIANNEQQQQQKDANAERSKYPEELRAQQELIDDMRNQKYGFKNWSSLIPLSVLKNKLKLEDSSYLTNGPSLYTFIRKTRSDIIASEEVIDINFMPPMIVKNCLPFAIKLKFHDSSGILQEIVFEKEEEKNLFCFSMAQSAVVDISLPDFETIKGFKLFNLERYTELEDVIRIQDRYGRSTLIYSQIQRKQAGQRIIFYCKKMMIDTIDSELLYYYKRPDAHSTGKDMMRNMIPFVNLSLQRQKIYIIPEGQSFGEIYAALSSASTKNAFVKMDLEATATQMELRLDNAFNSMNFCYSSDVYLATQNEYIYTKITTVSPYYVVVNESKQTIILEQSEIPGGGAGQNHQQFPLILDPGQRQAFQFYKFQTKYQGQAEFVHIKVCDEQILSQILEEKYPSAAAGARPRNSSFRKRYSWSSPFQISSVAQFTVQLASTGLDERDTKEANTLTNSNQRALLRSMLQSDQHLRVTCKTDQGDCLGSMFIIIRDEAEEQSEYKIINESQHVDLIYKQAIDKSKIPQKISQIRLSESAQHSQRLSINKTTRFCWGSVLHAKLLRLSFTSTYKSFKNAKLTLQTHSEVQKQLLTSQVDMVVPLDKIGLCEDISLVQVPGNGMTELQSFTSGIFAKVRITITTNGFSKILKIQDYQEDQPEVVPELNSRHDWHRYLNPALEGLHMSTVEVLLDEVCLSFIHKKRELLTIFISKIQANIEDTQETVTTKFNVGYLQIDNQSENEPTYMVMMKPRDLFCKDGKILVKLAETEKERQEREQLGNDLFTDENAKMFMSEIVINKKANSKDVVYIERIVFLMQTLQIQIQFTHFLKVASFVYHLGKVLNKGVTKVHYVFEDQSLLNHVAEGDKVIMDYGDSAQQKKRDRLNNFKKQDVLVGSKVKAQSLKKIDAVKMSNRDSNWQFSSKMVAQSSWRIFIQNYQSSPVELIVSAINERLKKDKTKKGQELGKNFDEIESQRQLIQNGLLQQDEHLNDDGEDVIGLFGARDEQFARRALYFSTFEDMLFQMNGLNISNLFGEGNEVLGQLATFHKETFKYNALRLLGSSNLLGNPSRYVSNMGTGVTDFFVKPYQGMKDGSVLQAADGFAQGSKSLLTNTLMAPVGAVSRIGNSISKGTLALSFDDQFIQAKNYDNNKNKPKNIGDGVVKGFSSAGTSIFSGVAGVFTKPIEGAQQDGVGGFFKGIGKGAAGLVTKTVSGTIDIVAKTTEGLDNQTKDTNLSTALSTRIRNPRPFYEVHHLIRPYNQMHANWQQVIPQMSKEMDMSCIYDIFEIVETPKIETRPSKGGDRHLKSYESTVFVVTKYFIAQLSHTFIADMNEERPQNPFDQQRQEAALTPDPTGKIHKDGTGSKITIEGLYLMKHLAFAELLNKSVLILGFKYNQRENVLQDVTQGGYPVTHVLITPQGENQKQVYYATKGGEPGREASGVKVTRIAGALRKQSPDQMNSLKEKLFNRYFDEIDLMNQDPSKQPRKVHAEAYSLTMNFPDDRKAVETNALIEKVKAILRHEMKEERIGQEQARRSSEQKHENWEVLEKKR